MLSQHSMPKPLVGSNAAPEVQYRSAGRHRSARPHCCLTPRSSRAPTAGHQAPATGTVYIFCGRGLASHRRCRLTSNVRQQEPQSFCSTIRRAMGPAASSGYSSGQTVVRHRCCGPRTVNAETAGWQQRRARGSVQVRWQAHVCASALLPNPSLKASPNGKTPGPRGSAGYHLPPGPGVSPLGPP
jgi:hypothetical protein